MLFVKLNLFKSYLTTNSSDYRLIGQFHDSTTLIKMIQPLKPVELVKLSDCSLINGDRVANQRIGDKLWSYHYGRLFEYIFEGMELIGLLSGIFCSEQSLTLNSSPLPPPPTKLIEQWYRAENPRHKLA